MMNKWGNKILSMLICTWGGTLYFLLEVLYKSINSRQEQISWTMLIVALFLCIPVERCGYNFSWDCPLILQAFTCAVLVTVVEFICGLFLNVYLHLNIWDYSNLPFNLMGQVCVSFSLCGGYFVLFLFLFSILLDIVWKVVKNLDTDYSNRREVLGE